jgi:hypothetical protein
MQACGSLSKRHPLASHSCTNFIKSHPDRGHGPRIDRHIMKFTRSEACR